MLLDGKAFEIDALAILNKLLKIIYQVADLNCKKDLYYI